MQKQTAFVLLGAAMVASTSLPANAGTFDDLIRSYLGVGEAQRIAPNQSFIRTNFSTRLGQLRDQLNYAVSSGQLSEMQAQGLRQRFNNFELDLNAALVSEGGLTFDEVNSLLARVNTIGSDLSSAIASGSVSTTVAIGPINSRIASMEAQLANGQLSHYERRELRTALDQIIDMRDRMAYDGLNPSESSRLIVALDNLNARFNSYLAVRPDTQSSDLWADIDDRLARTRVKINREYRRGNLTAAQVRSAQNSLRWIERMHDELTEDEELEQEDLQFLRTALNRVDGRINTWVASRRSRYY